MRRTRVSMEQTVCRCNFEPPEPTVGSGQSRAANSSFPETARWGDDCSKETNSHTTYRVLLGHLLLTVDRPTSQTRQDKTMIFQQSILFYKKLCILYPAVPQLNNNILHPAAPPGVHKTNGKKLKGKGHKHPYP